VRVPAQSLQIAEGFLRLLGRDGLAIDPYAYPTRTAARSRQRALLRGLRALGAYDVHTRICEDEDGRYRVSASTPYPSAGAASSQSASRRPQAASNASG
jgi:hypothetical protein